MRPIDDRDELRRRFVEAARRAQIVSLVNRARTEAELGDFVTAELCEAFEAEIAFVLAPVDGHVGLVGAYGLQPDDAERLPAQGVLDQSIEATQVFEGRNLLSVGARALVLAPFWPATGRGVVGVARLHEVHFDEAEAALLEAVTASIAHGLERLRLADERDRLYRQAHEQAQAARVIGAIGDGVVLLDDAGIVQLWNPAAEAITGVPREAVVGRPLREAIPSWSAVADSLGIAGDPTASSHTRATTIPLDLDGRELWLSIRAVGFAEGTVYAFHDLTEERRLEQLKADFIATVSHELRTPLAAVHGAAKTLLRDDIDLDHDVSRQLLGLVSDQSDRLARMVEDILLASRLESPELELTAEHVDVGELAADAIEATRLQASEQLTLELSVAPSLPPVAGDRDKLRQVLVNLVANAVKYSPAGGRIHVEVKAEDGRVAIVVRDEGLGIAPSEQSLIFEKFYRADANMTRGVSGSGLGLYISRELIHRMGGSISVESEPGEGSTFVVTLPTASMGLRRPGAGAPGRRS